MRRHVATRLEAEVRSGRRKRNSVGCRQLSENYRRKIYGKTAAEVEKARTKFMRTLPGRPGRGRAAVGASTKIPTDRCSDFIHYLRLSERDGAAPQ